MYKDIYFIMLLRLSRNQAQNDRIRENRKLAHVNNERVPCPEDYD